MLLASYLTPHPPLLIPEIGGGNELKIKNTINSMQDISREIKDLSPELIIYISPHSIVYSDYFHISPGESAIGDFKSFGSEKISDKLEYDTEFIDIFETILDNENFYAGTKGEKDKKLDHGCLVPMHFIHEHYRGYKAVRVSISGLDYYEHYRFGMALKKAIDISNKKTVLIASGDLSHNLKQDGPYGFTEEGPEFDNKIQDIIRTSNFLNLLQFDEEFCKKAGECGLRSLIILAGVLDKRNVESKLMSYEGPFGVGYAVASFRITEENLNRNFLEQAISRDEQQYKTNKENEDIYVKLARITVEHLVNSNTVLDFPKDLPNEMLNNKAGVFVSIKKKGLLRGCIGTISPTTHNIASEIIQNAISSAQNDNRFSPITKPELSLLSYSVDILMPAQEIKHISELDVKKYGVIVSCGNKRGLLLPNLEGVNTTTEQLAIAMQKGGISPKEPYKLERFEVVRHT